MADKWMKTRVGRVLADYLGMAVALIVLLVIFGLAAENFFTLTTFRTIANQIPDTAIAAVGMTFVLMSRSIPAIPMALNRPPIVVGARQTSKAISTVTEIGLPWPET